jgi:hypothetical protein
MILQKRNFRLSISLAFSLFILQFGMQKNIKAQGIASVLMGEKLIQPAIAMHGYPNDAGAMKDGKLFFTNQFFNEIKLNLYDPESKEWKQSAIKPDYKGNYGYIVKVFSTGEKLWALNKVSYASPLKQVLYAVEINLEDLRLTDNMIELATISNAPEINLSPKGVVPKSFKEIRDAIRCNFAISYSDGNQKIAVANLKKMNADASPEIFVVKVFDKDFNVVSENEVNSALPRTEVEFGALQVDTSGYAHLILEKYTDINLLNMMMYFGFPKGAENPVKTIITFSGNMPARSNIYFQKDGIAFRRLPVAHRQGYPTYVLRLNKNIPYIAGLYSNMANQLVEPMGYFILKINPTAKANGLKFISFDAENMKFFKENTSYWTIRDLEFFDNGGFLLHFTQIADEKQDQYSYLNENLFKNHNVFIVAGADNKYKNIAILPTKSASVLNPVIVKINQGFYAFFNDHSDNDYLVFSDKFANCDAENMSAQYLAINPDATFKRSSIADLSGNLFYNICGNAEGKKVKMLVKSKENEVYRFATVTVR